MFDELTMIEIKNSKKNLIFTTFYHHSQGGHIKIHSHSDIPVQVDGEPWIQPPGEVVVFNSALKVSVMHTHTYLSFRIL